MQDWDIGEASNLSARRKWYKGEENLEVRDLVPEIDLNASNTKYHVATEVILGANSFVFNYFMHTVVVQQITAKNTQILAPAKNA